MDKEANIEKRLNNLRNKMREKDIDAVLVVKRANVIYLSGFTGTAAYLLITGEDAVIVTDFRYKEQAELEAGLYDVVQYQGNVAPALEQQLKLRGVKRLGFEETFLSFERYREFQNNLGINEMVPMEGMVESLRIVKDDEEAERIKKAVGIADMAFSHVLQYIKPGVREIEIAAEIEYYMRKHGAKGTSFETIVASGTRSAMPHGVASEKPVEHGEAITFDFGAVYKDYCSDITRTVFLGQPSCEMKKIYGIVLDAQILSLEAIKSELDCVEIDRTARDFIEKAGYGSFFGHGLGHGVGLEVHEAPRLFPNANGRLLNGMTVTVEPGIYLSGMGGVRIEDLVIIRNDRALVLTKAPKEMIIL